jgi:hypothetical protein
MRVFNMKDPAALLYIDKWINATMEMKADARAYYMDLILSQYDKGSLPDDIEELANICRVRVSEFDNFKQVFEQVLKHKFKQICEGRLENDFAREIIQKREKFLKKRSDSGKLSYIIRFAIKKFKANKEEIKIIKQYIDLNTIDTKDEQVLEQVIEQIFELYINEDEDIIKYKDILEKNIIPLFDIKPNKSQLKKWDDCYRLLITSDGYNSETIFKTIKWARDDTFWKPNFQSFLKLRDKDKNGIKYIDRFIEKIDISQTPKVNNSKPQIINDMGNE